MKKVELVFLPMPAMGHLVSMVETAKLLLQHDDRFSITILIIQPSAQSSVSAYIKSLDDDGAATANNNTTNNRIRFIILPKPPEDLTKDVPPQKFLLTYVGGHKNQVKDIVKSHLSSGDCGTITGGFVIDMFCTPMIDVATELGLPTFLFISSGACFLSIMLNAEFLLGSAEELETDLLCPGFVTPLPVKVLPTGFLVEEWKTVMFDFGRKYKETQGILVNSILELEPYMFDSLSFGTTKKNNPPVFHVGPILNLKGVTHPDQSSSTAHDESEIMKWLDDQPPCSVVFLCFGSMGSFSVDQVREIACALEETGYRFLWSLRKQETNKGIRFGSTDYSNLEEVLPQGFLNRTAGIGKVIGWAPQVRVLAHSSVGGFVSHCGWNSTLESMWFGVPIAAWPVYAEQQLNAFHLVKELGLAVEIQIDYRRDPRMRIEPPVVTAEKISRGIVELMDRESDVRKRTKEMSEKVRKASVMGGGSSSLSLDCFLNNFLDNINKSS